MANSIDAELNELYKKLDKLHLGLKQEIQENKKIKKKAASFVLPIMKSKIPVFTGNLKKSIQFLPIGKRSGSVWVGPLYKTAPHCGLVEFGHVKQNGQFHNGIHYVRNTYDEVKSTLLNNLVNESKVQFEKLGRQISI